MEIFGDLRSSKVRNDRNARQQGCERIGHVLIVECGHKWERTPDVQRNVCVSIIVCSRVAATNDELVATGNPPHDPVVAGTRIPVKSESRLPIVFVASRNRPYAETWILT